MAVLDKIKNSLRMNNQNQQEFGSFEHNPNIIWSPHPPRSGDIVHIYYQGLLQESGASEVYLHYGFDGWKNSETRLMERNKDGSFGISLEAKGNQELNFCFKDVANNWDNNDGENWTIRIM